MMIIHFNSFVHLQHVTEHDQHNSTPKFTELLFYSEQ